MKPPPPRFDLFAACPPGLERWLHEEICPLGWSAAKPLAGGVSFAGSWPDVYRANLLIRGASRILLRLGTFRARNLGELEAACRALPLHHVIAEGTEVRASATCRSSRIYHSGAAEERLMNAARVSGGVAGEGGITLVLRIEKNICTVSADTSGELLHKRGFKIDVARAPMRETTAALLLRACGYRGEEPVLDPMCGSGTIVLEAAQIAAGLPPGRARRFAFEAFAGFDEDAYGRIRDRALTQAARRTGAAFHGFDRAADAIRASAGNARRAGVEALTVFSRAPLSTIRPPDGPPGLVLTNPPYGARLGRRDELAALYRALGSVIQERFAGWRVGFVTSDDALARATGLRLGEPGPWFPHGGLRIRLWTAG